MALFFGNTVKRDNPYAYHPISKKENINTMMEHIAYFVSEEESQTQLSTFANVLYHSDYGKQGQNILHFSLYKDGRVAYFQRGLWKKGQLCSGMFRFDPDYHQYLTVNGFVSRKRTTENCFQINATVMDFDFASSKKEKAEHATPSRIREKTVRTLEVLYDNVEKGNLPEPTMIVFTGRGIHVYYVYDRSISYRVKGGVVNKLVHMHTSLCDTLYSKVKGMLTEDCLVLDPACKDISRVLRVPGSYNQKAQRHAVILTADGPYHDIFEMKKVIGRKERKKPKHKKVRGPDNVILFPYDPTSFMMDNDSELAEQLLSDPDYLSEAKTFRIEFEPTGNERYATAMQYRRDYLEKLQELCNQNGICSGVRHSMNFLYYVTVLLLFGRDFPLAPKCLADFNDHFIVPQSDAELDSIVKSLVHKKHTSYYYSTERFLKMLTDPIQRQCADLDPRYIFYHLRDDQNSQPSAYQIQHKADIEHAHFLFVEQGKSREEVAKIFGVTPTTISNWMRKAKDEYNLPSRQCKPRKEAGNSEDKRKAQRQEKMKKAVELHDQMHMTQTQIAAELHVCRATVSRWLNQKTLPTETQTIDIQNQTQEKPKTKENIQKKDENETVIVESAANGENAVRPKKRSRKKYEALPCRARMADVAIMIQEGQASPNCLSTYEENPENGCNIKEPKIKNVSDITLCSGSQVQDPDPISPPDPRVEPDSQQTGSVYKDFGDDYSYSKGNNLVDCTMVRKYSTIAPYRQTSTQFGLSKPSYSEKSYELWYRHVENLRGVEEPADWDGDVPFGFYEDPSFYDDPDPFGTGNTYENVSLFQENNEDSITGADLSLEQVAAGMEFFARANKRKLPDGVCCLEGLIDFEKLEPVIQAERVDRYDSEPEPIQKHPALYILPKLANTTDFMEFLVKREKTPLPKGMQSIEEVIDFDSLESVISPESVCQMPFNLSQTNAENLIRNFLIDDNWESQLPALQREQSPCQYPWSYPCVPMTGYVEQDIFDLSASAPSEIAKQYVLGWAASFCSQLDKLSGVEKREFMNCWITNLNNWPSGETVKNCHFKYSDWLYAFVMQARAYQFSKHKKQKRG